MAHRNEAPVMEVKGLKKHYRASGKGFSHTVTRAVDGVDFALRPGETFGVVGESGCGKSTIAKLMMGLETPTEGEVYFRGERIDDLPESKKREMRPRFQMVFQDSGSSLNPRKRVMDILAEPMLYHGVAGKKDVQARVEALLEQVGMVVLRSIRRVKTPPMVSIPRDRGVTSSRTTSFTSPVSTPP